MASRSANEMKSLSLDGGILWENNESACRNDSSLLGHLPEMENVSVDDYLEQYYESTRSFGDAFRRGSGIFACTECGKEFRKMWSHPAAGEGRMIRHLQVRHKVKELTIVRDSKALLAKLKWKKLEHSTIYVCPYCNRFSIGLSVDRGTTMEVDNEVIGHMQNLHPLEWKRLTSGRKREDQAGKRSIHIHSAPRIVTSNL